MVYNSSGTTTAPARDSPGCIRAPLDYSCLGIGSEPGVRFPSKGSPVTRSLGFDSSLAKLLQETLRKLSAASERHIFGEWPGSSSTTLGLKRSRRLRTLPLLLLVLAVFLAVDVTRKTPTALNHTTLTQTGSSLDYVVTILMENHPLNTSYPNGIIGDPNLPYINSLAKNYSLANYYFAAA